MRFLLLDSERVVGAAQTNGREQAIRCLQKAHGGQVHYSCRVPVLIGARGTSGSVRAEEAVMLDGELLLRAEVREP